MKDKTEIRDTMVNYFTIIVLKYRLLFYDFEFGFKYFGSD